MRDRARYKVNFRSQQITFPDGKIECAGANKVEIHLTAAQVSAGVTFDGLRGHEGLNVFACPDAYGVIDRPIEVVIPSAVIKRVNAIITILTYID